jgi:hypothetical protein
MKPLPKHSRTAVIADNMLSPEQLTSSVYEADVHKIAEKHFHQRVMQETPEDRHLDGLPGYDVVSCMCVV